MLTLSVNFLIILLLIRAKETTRIIDVVAVFLKSL